MKDKAIIAIVEAKVGPALGVRVDFRISQKYL
jgi:hypothetical protein